MQESCRSRISADAGGASIHQQSAGLALELVFTIRLIRLTFLFLFQGYDWSQGLDYEKLLSSYLTTGFQATSFGLAVQEINRMVGCLCC